MNAGKVYLVGAGPGHPELLTLKAAELLRTTDVVVYDRLVQEEVVALASPSAERIFMGKPVGRHESRQDAVNELLVRKALEGKTVVRLKGGDPFLFGRGAEEAEYLAERGICFEVIPGVSSALAAPLSAGIPVTHRNVASSVAVITGHEAKEEESRVDWSALARIDTLVFLMGVHNAGRIAERLIAHGREPRTPAAMIQMAFWHNERVLVSKLESLADDVAAAGIKPPATLVVGEVCSMHEKLSGAHRDLRRRRDDSSRFQPAPSPDQLFRLVSSGMASQLLGLGLESGVFDLLESPMTATDAAHALQFDADATAEILGALAALGLLENTGDAWLNLDLASRYLTKASSNSLRLAILNQAALSGGWQQLRSFAEDGCRGTFSPGGQERHRDACEAVARFAAPSVVERLEAGGPSLLIGWGADAYRTAFAECWPGVTLCTWNPFLDGSGTLNGSGAGPVPESLLGSMRYRTVVLSGILSSCESGQVERLLEDAANAVGDGGVIALHDSFLPESVLPPPDVVLGALARRISRGGCRCWSLARLGGALTRLGFTRVRSQPLAAATVLVTAARN
jgi:uroporphyrin-III C-methyltransferase